MAKPADMGRSFADFANWLIPHRKRVHIAVFLLTLLMIPGVLTALQPIDMESYEMDSPELEAQSIIDNEFANSEIILGFLVSHVTLRRCRLLKNGHQSLE